MRFNRLKLLLVVESSSVVALCIDHDTYLSPKRTGSVCCVVSSIGVNSQLLYV
jgi:hypothetical protein